MREGLVDKAKDMIAKNEEARNKKRKEQGGNTGMSVVVGQGFDGVVRPEFCRRVGRPDRFPLNPLPFLVVIEHDIVLPV